MPSALPFAILSTLALVAGWLVFRFGSMVRATLALLLSFLATAGLFVLLDSEFLFAITFLMMIGEMVIMLMFMVAFMMNPAGLNPMSMVHQPRFAAIAAITVFAALSAAVLSTRFPPSAQTPPTDVTAAIGRELLGPSMLIFETAGVALLAGMIGVVALAARRGRFGDAVVVRRDTGRPRHDDAHDHHGGGEKHGH